MDVWSTGKGRAAASEEQAALASVKYHIRDRPGNLWACLLIPEMLVRVQLVTRH